MTIAKPILIALSIAIFMSGAAAETNDTLSKEAEDALARRDAMQMMQKAKEANEKRAQESAKLTPQERYCPKKVDMDELKALTLQANYFQGVVADTRRVHALESQPNLDLKDAQKKLQLQAIAHNQEAMAAEADMDCRLRDGRQRIAFMLGGYAAALEQERDWKKAYETIGYFKTYYGDNAFTQMLEPVYWTGYAWDARGGGYASSVSEDGWRLFKERLSRAEKTLLDVKATAAKLPVWYEQMLDVQNGLGEGDVALYQTMLEGTERFPEYYPIYFTYLNSILPKWGGSWQQVDGFIRWSSKRAKADGDAMYARLYWVVAESNNSSLELFKETPATWKRMKLGFETMMKQYPDSQWNRNGFAAFACIANDKATYKKLRTQIDTQLMKDAWPGNVTPYICDHKLGFAK